MKFGVSGCEDPSCLSLDELALCCSFFSVDFDLLFPKFGISYGSSISVVAVFWIGVFILFLSCFLKFVNCFVVVFVFELISTIL